MSFTATEPSCPPANAREPVPTLTRPAYAVTAQDFSRPASRRQPTGTRPRLTVPVFATTSVSVRASSAGVVVLPPVAVSAVPGLATLNVCVIVAPRCPAVSVWRTWKVCWPAGRPE